RSVCRTNQEAADAGNVERPTGRSRVCLSLLMAVLAAVSALATAPVSLAPQPAGRPRPDRVPAVPGPIPAARPGPPGARGTAGLTLGIAATRRGPGWDRLVRLPAAVVARTSPSPDPESLYCG